jgi:hypothetical protein
VRNVKFQIYEWQRVTDSGAFTAPVARFIIFTKRATSSGALPYFYETRQWHVCFLYIQNAQSLVRSLDETRHCQWRAAIRIFEILRFSFLFLIILI